MPRMSAEHLVWIGLGLTIGAAVLATLAATTFRSAARETFQSMIPRTGRY